MTVAELKEALDYFDDDKPVFTTSNDGEYTPLDVYFSEEQVVLAADGDSYVDAVVMY